LAFHHRLRRCGYVSASWKESEKDNQFKAAMRVIGLGAAWSRFHIAAVRG
jgi:hypothetical protein